MSTTKFYAEELVPSGDDGDGWDEFDEFVLDNLEYATLDGRRLLSYTLGAIASTAFILRGSLVLNYPLSLFPGLTSKNEGIDAVFAFAIICLVVLATDLYVRCVTAKRTGFINGLWLPYVSLGFYLLPQISIHPPFILVVLIAGVALTAWDYGGIAHVIPDQGMLWDFVTNATFVAYLVVSIGGAGLLPMAISSSPTADVEAGRDIATLNALMDKESLADMSYQEVADMMQSVAHIESERLGMLDCEPRVTVGYTGTAVANYSTLTRAITLSASRLSSHDNYSGPDAISSIAHEMAHAYEHAVVEGRVKGRSNSPLGELTPEDTAQWHEELNAHVDANRDFDTYWHQDIEVRARRYADDEMEWIAGIVGEERNRNDATGLSLGAQSS